MFSGGLRILPENSRARQPRREFPLIRGPFRASGTILKGAFLNIDPAFLAIILMQYVCLLFSLCVHEAAHAAMADRCGDPSARLLGRLTLNPVKHADPVGTVIFPLLAMFLRFPFIFGWAKPVPFNPINLRDRNRDPVLIALAGPASNLVLAILFSLVLRVLVLMQGIETVEGLFSSPACVFVFYMVVINLVLMLFNLIPLPPLDGHYVLNYFLPPEGQRVLMSIGPFGIIFAVLIGARLIAVPLNYLRTVVVMYALEGLGFLL